MKATPIRWIGVAIGLAAGGYAMLGATWSGSPKGAAAQEQVLPALMAGLRAREARAGSIECYIVDENFNNPDIAQIPNLSARQTAEFSQPPQLQLLFWAAQGAKCREDLKVVIGSEDAQRMDAYDGTHELSWVSGSPTVNEKEKFVIGSVAYLLQLPLGKGARDAAMSKVIGQYPVRYVGTELVGGLQTYKLQSVPNVGPTIYSWWIAPARDYMVVKTEQVPGPASNDQYDNFSFVDDMRQIDGVWVPIVVRDLGFTTAAGGGALWWGMTKHTVLAIAIDSELPNQLFELPLEPGTVIAHADGSRELVGGDKDTFSIAIRQAQQSGHQPDFASLDISAYEAAIHAGLPAGKELQPVPASEWE